MLACLITLSPLLSGSEERVSINLCSVADRRVTGLGGTRWEPAVTEAPAIGMQFWNGDFEQGTDAGKVDFTFNLEQTRKAYPQVINAVWMGALVEVWIGVVGAPAPWKQRFRGRVTSYAGGEYPAMKIAASVDVEPFNVDLLDVYKGTTGAEGGSDLKDKTKPLALGRPRNVEPVLINAVDSVYQFSAYGPIEGVEVLYERASAFSPSVGNYPNYTTLVAASIPPGRWAECRAQGMIRLGAPAAGVITADIRGHSVGGVAPRGAGALVMVLAHIAGVAPSLIAQRPLAALDAEGATASDVMVTDQVKFLEAARRLILPCNWQVVVSNLGILRAVKPAFAPIAMMVLHAQGRREPLVTAVTENPVSVPYKKTTMAAERNWRVHSLDEIASDVTLVLRGDYDPTTVYRAGNIVTMPGGSRWEYISDTPQAGITPGSDPTVWATMEGPGRYSDGTPLDDLQPAEPGSDVTGDHTSNDTAHVGGVPTAEFLARVVELEDILGPTGEVQVAIDGIRGDLGVVEDRADAIEAQIAGTSDSYLKTQIELAAGYAAAAGQEVTTLRSDVFGNGGLAAQVTTQQGTLDTLAGRTAAYWQVEVDAGSAGTDAFVTVRAETSPGGPVTSDVAIGAKTFMVYNPFDGAWIKTLEVSGGNVRIYGNLAVDGSVTTNNLVDNAVSESNFNILELYGASVGTDDDNIWRNFAYGGVSLSATFNNPAGGGDATAAFWVTLIGTRTGGDNDRISIRVRRDDGTIILPAEWTNILFESGGNTVVPVQFFDPDPPLGGSTYTVQTKNLEGHPAWQRGTITPLRLSK